MQIGQTSEWETVDSSDSGNIEAVSPPIMDTFEGTLGEPTKLFGSNHVALDNNRDPLSFYADVRLTPLRMNASVYQIVSSAPGLRHPKYTWKYSLIYNGRMSHSWSLLRATTPQIYTSPVVRPVAILETSGASMSYSESRILDLNSVPEAATIHLQHYYDSWSRYGQHVGFKTDPDYYYEWEPVQGAQKSDPIELYLWRINANNEEDIAPAARLNYRTLAKNPFDPSTKRGDNFWCVEVDLDRVAPFVALLSAFSIKSAHSRLHSWFAPRETTLLNPIPLVNFAFQDDGQLLQAAAKYWGDWEESRRRHDNGEEGSNAKNVLLIKVFSKEALRKHALDAGLLEGLNHEAEQNIARIRSSYGIEA